MTPAAMGAEAEVPVWDEVQRLCRSVVTTFRSPDEPELEKTQHQVRMKALIIFIFKGI